MSECLRSTALRVLHWKLRLLEIERSQLKTRVEALKITEQIKKKLEQIDRTKKAILERVEKVEHNNG